MATCVISGTVVDAAATPVSGAPVMFNIQTPILSADPVEGSTTTATNGTWSLTVQQGLSGVITIRVASGPLGRQNTYRFNVNVPTASTATFSSILVDS